MREIIVLMNPLIIDLGEIEGIVGLIGKLLLRKLLLQAWFEARLIVLLTYGFIELIDTLVKKLPTA